MVKFKTLGLASIAAAMYAIPAFAHHSFAMFDGDTILTREGTITEFHWVNPHSWVVMTSPDEQGEEYTWAFELLSPSSLARNGWVPKSLTPGMEVSATFHPLKSGEPGGSLMQIEISDGTVLSVHDPDSAE